VYKAEYPMCVLAYSRFDGDGMIHATRMSNGKASYARHQVMPERVAREKRAGTELFAKYCIQ
jgi:carotenoid cleavage dioxygenase-like enzyme